MDGSEFALIARFINWLLTTDHQAAFEQHPALTIACLMVVMVSILLVIMFLTSSV